MLRFLNVFLCSSGTFLSAPQAVVRRGLHTVTGYCEADYVFIGTVCAAACVRVIGIAASEMKYAERLSDAQIKTADIAECYADPAKAKKVLGWEAAMGIDDASPYASHTIFPHNGPMSLSL